MFQKKIICKYVLSKDHLFCKTFNYRRTHLLLIFHANFRRNKKFRCKVNKVLSINVFALVKKFPSAVQDKFVIKEVLGSTE